MKVFINTAIPFFLWKMVERDAVIEGNKILTKKMIKDDDTGIEKEDTYTNSLSKAPWWLISLVKYLPILLIILSADWGYHMWNGVGLFFAALYMLWFDWMTKNKPEHFYPVTGGILLALIVIGLWTGKLLYVNYILSYTVYFFLIVYLYNEIMFKMYEHYYMVDGRIGMFVYVPINIKKEEKHEGHYFKFFIAIAAISLIMIVANGALIFKEYQAQKASYVKWVAEQKNQEKEERSGVGKLVNVPVQKAEVLTQEQRQLREELGIEVEQ